MSSLVVWGSARYVEWVNTCDHSIVVPTRATRVVTRSLGAPCAVTDELQVRVNYIVISTGCPQLA